MSLLAPLYLLLGAAALVPLLIHLLRRRIGTRIDFPAARYLARAEQEHSRSLRLRNILLMLLRVAIVLFVASAAARPVIRLAGAGHGPTALAIVLDNSLSTTVVVDGHPLFEQFRGTAREIFAAANATDRLWLITADGRVRGGGKATLREELDRVEPLGGAGNLPLALAHAGAAVRSGGLDSRQIILLTDGQRTAWTQNADVGDVQVVLWLPGGTPPANHAVVSAEARPDRWTPRGAVVARLMSKDSTTYRITLGGRSIVRGTAAPGEEVVIRAAPPERGWVAGTIELEPDELPGDNVRHFAVWIGAPPGVSVAPSAGAFARSAVDVLKGSGRVVEGRDIAIVSADELTSLPALILAPSDPVRLGAANRALERAAVPWRFGAAHHGETSVTSAHRPSSASDSAQSGSFVDVSATVRYELVAQGVRVRIIGRPHEVPHEIRSSIQRAEDRTRHGTRMLLNIAFNYSGRSEIIDAVRALLAARVEPPDVTEELVERNLYTWGQPDVDLLIRTGGEHRMSNFLLWQSNYAELVFTSTLWPDFAIADLDSALAEFANRHRRFGS